MAVSNKKYIKNCTGNSHEKEKKVSRVVSLFIFRALLFVFVCVSVYVLFFSSYLRITDVGISGTEELDSKDISQKFSEFLDRKILKFIPNNNFLFISQDRVAELLKNDFKKIRSVSVAKKFPNVVSIAIEERKAMLVWCSGNNCFLVDEAGIAYNVADFNSQEILQNHLIRIDDQSNRNITWGEKIVDPAYEQYVLGIKDALKNINQEAGDEAFETPSNMAEEINVKTKKGFQIFFSSLYPLDKAVSALDIVLKKEIPEDQQEKIEYVDLRSEGRIFYKFKNTEENKTEENINNKLKILNFK